MTTILRGLLQSPVSTTLVSDEQTGSTETLHRHRQHCIDQWDNRREHEPCQHKSNQIFTNSENSICNIKMEENISDEMLWKNFSGKEEQEIVRVKQENTEQHIEHIEGVYYSYTIETGRNDWTDHEERKHYYVSPTHQKSPCVDKKNEYILGKEKLKRRAVMNVYTALDTPLPQGFSPSGVPDFTQEGFIASCFGSNFGYDGSFSQFDDSLSAPEHSLDLTKLDSYSMMDSKGNLSLSDCGGVFEYSDDMNLDPDWLHKSIALPTPDEQEGDVTFSPSTPYTSITDLTLPITPGSSHPPTPLSTSPNSDVEEVLSLFSDHNSNDSTGYLPNEYLPFGQSFDSFDTDTSQYSSPALTPVHSPFPSPYCTQEESLLPSSLSQDDSRVAIKDLLAKKSASTCSVETSQERKRKLPKSSSSDSSAPKPKRRLSLSAKKERKREQNKTAALRYRQKKKEEKSGHLSKLEILELKNSELKKTVSTMTAEIEYLKKLWSEVNAAKKLSHQQSLSVC